MWRSDQPQRKVVPFKAGKPQHGGSLQGTTYGYIRCNLWLDRKVPQFELSAERVPSVVGLVSSVGCGTALKYVLTTVNRLQINM